MGKRKLKRQIKDLNTSVNWLLEHTGVAAGRREELRKDITAHGALLTELATDLSNLDWASTTLVENVEARFDHRINQLSELLTCTDKKAALVYGVKGRVDVLEDERIPGLAARINKLEIHRTMQETPAHHTDTSSDWDAGNPDWPQMNQPGPCTVCEQEKGWWPGHHDWLCSNGECSEYGQSPDLCGACGSPMLWIASQEKWQCSTLPLTGPTGSTRPVSPIDGGVD